MGGLLYRKTVSYDGACDAEWHLVAKRGQFIHENTIREQRQVHINLDDVILSWTERIQKAEKKLSPPAACLAGGGP